MGAMTTHQPHASQPLTIGLRAGIVGLTLATAQIHASLGGLLFTLNAIGYGTLAVAMILPGPFGQMRWLARYALIGFASATIVGWVAIGPRFELAYISKVIEAALIALLLVEDVVADGGPLTLGRRIRRLLRASAA